MENDIYYYRTCVFYNNKHECNLRSYFENVVAHLIPTEACLLCVKNCYSSIDRIPIFCRKNNYNIFVSSKYRPIHSRITVYNFLIFNLNV